MFRVKAVFSIDNFISGPSRISHEIDHKLGVAKTVFARVIANGLAQYLMGLLGRLPIAI